jgi:hypothetical protein
VFWLTADTVRIITTTKVPTRGLLTPTMLADFWARRTLWDDPGGGSFFWQGRSLPDTSWDEDFAKRHFGDLNRGLLRLPGDGRIIIISDKRRHVKRMPPTPMLRHLLLWSPRPQPPLPLMPMKHPRGCKMVVMVVAPPIRK